MADTLTEAIKLVRLGYPVFPCDPNDKRPLAELVPNGLKNATLSEQIVKLWWQARPDANIAIETSSFCVVDIDTDDGEPNPWMETIDGLDTPMSAVSPRGGVHLWFKDPTGALRNSSNKLSPKVDTRANGGYVLTYPSIVNGKQYTWTAGPVPIGELPDLPDWIVEKLSEPKPESPKRPRQSTFRPTDVMDRAFKYLQAMGPAYANDGGGKKTFLAAQHMTRGFELSDPEALEVMLKWNGTCEPEWTEAELKHKIKSARADGGTVQWGEHLQDKDPRVDLSGIMNGTPSNNGHHANNGHQEANGHQSSESPEEWSDPIPLSADEAMECPIDAIPETPRNYLLQLAEATQTPVDLSVGMWLAAVGVAVQKKFAIEPMIGWREQLSFDVLMAMEPGNRKSAVATAIGQPIREHENSLREAAAPIIRAAKAEFELRSKQRNRLLDDASKAQLEIERNAILHELKELDEEIAANPIPCEPSLLVDDVTPEHLATISARNKGRIGILTAEGDFFDIIAGRYSKNPNIGFFLKAHCGDEHRVDRGNRPSELIKSPAMSVGFCVQPSVLRGLLAQDTFRGRGLLARLLPIIPRTLLGHRKINPDPVDPFVELGYRNQMGRMLRMPTEETEDDFVPEILRLNSDAGQVFNEYRQEIEIGLRDFGELESIRDWAGKLPGAVARIAAVLHLAKHSELWPIPQTIDGATMQDAIRLGKYLTSHSQTAFQLMGADENRAMAEHLIGVIKRHELREFNRSKIHTITRRRVDRPEDLDKPLSILVDHGFLQEVETKSVGKGRKPTQLYTSNPSLFTEGA